MVLILGSRGHEQGSQDDAMVGLILLHEKDKDGFEWYRRQGFCWWDVLIMKDKPPPVSEPALFLGKSSEWTCMEGTFE